ncbi:acyl-CoA dehydrogenase family protein [Elioraea tepida]|jgi:alkylation response protein AidB-like acyl-CoA dehydrogenase|uniref:3-sulfinopropanoyl-CoA desulfinase n=1 Tax=Elioraea tepida TaxID=2843330 RepID=A0A975U1F5_9PROT|nr:3-sulfinopropanoyl-CoA desulfinase [Elioraea tepida]QXM24480.1 acyl-CoA dehydrogenase family protein [Elioraea tepida]
MELTEREAALKSRARAFAEAVVAPRAAEIDRTESYPWDLVAALREAGFLGMTIPEALGGRAASYFDAVLVIEEMARHCAVAGRICVEANMGALGAVMAYGTEDQKRLAADLVLGEGDKPAICITEPEAGSAATEMRTRAERRQGGWVINGRKHWITGGGVSKLHLIFARAVENGVEQGIGGFIAVRRGEGDPPGLVIGPRQHAMGVRGIPETVVELRDLFIPDTMVLPSPGGFRRGFGALMDAYNAQRVGAATVALGIAAGALDHAIAYARRREQFGRPIAEFQGIQWMLADMAVAVDAARAMVHRAARSRGPNGFPDPVLAAKAKILAAETAVKVTNDALQIWGSAGYARDNPMERMVRDARMFTIAGGTAQILRNLVASDLLGMKLPQTRDGWLRVAERRAAAE